MKGVFVHKPDSGYDDVKGERYHFPRTYLTRVEKTLGDWIVYYEQFQGKPGRYYTGIGRVVAVRPDPSLAGHFYADLDSFLDFDRLVEYKENGGFEARLVREDGSINGGTAQSAVRIVDEAEFAAIVAAGLSEELEWPDRFDDPLEEREPIDPLDLPKTHQMSEAGQPDLVGAPFERAVKAQLANRKWRDRKFRHHVRVAYDRTCAFTGLRLINGRGRPEVEAAHIRPVEKGGNDWIRNGIALSGTVHWMFDRGMLSLSDDFRILQSRHLNYDISHMLRKEQTALVPADERLTPHPEYLRWHRDEVFKW